METLNGVLGSLGLLGILFAILLGVAYLVILPIWSIVDCVRSNETLRDRCGHGGRFDPAARRAGRHLNTP